MQFDGADVCHENDDIFRLTLDENRLMTNLALGLQDTGAFRLRTCEASRFDSIRIGRSDSIRFERHGPIRKFSNLPCLPIARRSQTTRTINGA